MARRTHVVPGLLIGLLIAVGAAACGGDEPGTQSVTAVQWPEADRLFRQDPRWLGSDGAYSVPLDDGRILWLFGDTFVATSSERARSKAAFVRNSIGIQDGSDPTDASMRFYWGNADGRPASFFAEDGDRWLWPKHGVQIGRRLVVFLSRIKLKRGEPCCFNFAGDGWRAAIVDDAAGDPDGWRVRVVSPPADFPAPVPEAVNVVGDHAVVLAVSDRFTGHLVRWPVDDLAAGRVDRAEWWTGSRGWIPYAELTGRPARVIEKVGPEASLHFDDELDRWVLVWTEGFGAATVVVSFAERIEGPWSPPTEVFRPREGDRPGNLVYAGKGHPKLAGADLPVTYVASKSYYPRFVKLTFSSR